MKLKQFFSDPMRAYLTLTVLYFLLIFILPSSKAAMAAYDLTSNQYHILLFLLVSPFAAIWFAAFYGYYKLRQYGNLVDNTKEGGPFSQLATGLGCLAYGLPVAAILSIVLAAIANENSSFMPTSVIINNYVSLIIPLIGFIFISNATKGLTSTLKLNSSLSSARFLVAFFILLGVLYCYFTFQQFDLNSLSSSDNPYYLPIWLLLSTITIPFLYSWFIGLLSAYELIQYSRNSHGLLYRQALQLVGYGIVAVIVSFIALQYVSSLVPRDGFLSINYTLVSTYITSFVMAAGFVSIAVGAHKLRKIEEV